jgi:threonine/homoserine/homoserine lactone efflux protein
VGVLLRRRRVRRVLNGTAGIGLYPNVWAFIAVALPLVLTPGVSTAAVLRASVMRGTPAALMTAVGLNLSSVCYGLLSALGLPTLARKWPVTLVILRYAGGAYVLWLGVTALARGVQRFLNERDLDRRLVPDSQTAANRTPFVEGFIVNSLNPPIATFYLVILPQFVPRGGYEVRSTLLLTAVHVAMAASWHVAWALAGGALAAHLRAGRPRAVLEVLTGAALSALGIAILI